MSASCSRTGRASTFTASKTLEHYYSYLLLLRLLLSTRVRTIVMCDVLPLRIADGAMCTLAVSKSSQPLFRRTQMGIAVKKPLIRRLHPGFCGGGGGGSLSLPLLDRLTKFLPPLIQELCLPINGHLRTQNSWLQQMRLCKCLPPQRCSQWQIRRQLFRG